MYLPLVFRDNFVWYVVAGVAAAVSGKAMTWLGPHLGLSAPWVDRLVGATAAFTFMMVVAACVWGMKRYRRRGIERLARTRYIQGDKGILDFHVNLDTAGKEIGRILNTIGRESAWIGKRAGRRARQYGAARTMRARHRVTSRAANDMHQASARISIKLAELEEATRIAQESMRAVVASTNREAGDAIRRDAKNLIDKVDQALVTQEVFRAGIVATKGMSQDLNVAAERLHAVLERIRLCLETQRATARETFDSMSGPNARAAMTATPAANVTSLPDRAGKER